MNSFRLKAVLFFLIFQVFSGLQGFSWGFFGHRLINGKAVFCLPPEMFAFYKNNLDYLTEHSVDPDKRRYAVKEEAPRHYIDLDHFVSGKKNVDVKSLTDVLPSDWKKAVEKYGEDSLQAYGILPWHLQLMMYRLTEAFKNQNANEIIKLSAEIGHYAADAHVPLHTTENYNGQLTGQKGIHGLWETRIPERKSESYDFLGIRAEYLEDIPENIWSVISESHNQVDFVLDSEKELRSKYKSDKIYRPSTVGRKVSPQFTSEYVDSYAESNGKLVEQRAKDAVFFISSLWYTAWVNAGQPDLLNLKSDLVPEQNGKVKKNSEPDHER